MKDRTFEGGLCFAYKIENYLIKVFGNCLHTQLLQPSTKILKQILYVNSLNVFHSTISPLSLLWTIEQVMVLKETPKIAKSLDQEKGSVVI